MAQASPSQLERQIRVLKTDLAKHEGGPTIQLLTTYRRIIDELHAEILEMLQLAERQPWLNDRDVTRRTLRRLDQLLLDAQIHFAEFVRVGDNVLGATRQDGARAGLQASKQLLRSVTGTGGFDATINNVGLRALTTQLSDGSPVRQVLEGYGRNAADVIEREFTSGMAKGLVAQTIMKRIANQTNGGEVTARMQALVRTELLRAYRESQLSAYREIGEDVIPQWRWSAAKTRRTCIACLAMDGRLFPITMPFDRAHVQCRCVAIPVPDPAYADPVPLETGAQWFAKQPPEVQRRLLPSKEAYNAYKAGALNLNDFVGQRHDDTWGTSVYVLSGKRAMQRRQLDPARFGDGPRSSGGGSAGGGAGGGGPKPPGPGDPGEVSRLNPNAVRGPKGIWNEDSMPEEKWEVSNRRVVLPEPVQKALGLDRAVLRWEETNFTYHVKKRPELSDLDFMGGEILRDWTMVGTERKSRGSQIIFFDIDGSEWAAAINTGRYEIVIRTMFMARDDYSVKQKQTMRNITRR